MESSEKPKKDEIVLKTIERKEPITIKIKDIPFGGIRVGRGCECEIRSEDKSVSEIHSII